jgi:hypothetical protein
VPSQKAKQAYPGRRLTGLSLRYVSRGPAPGPQTAEPERRIRFGQASALGRLPLFSEGITAFLRPSFIHSLDSAFLASPWEAKVFQVKDSERIDFLNFSSTTM